MIGISEDDKTVIVSLPGGLPIAQTIASERNEKDAATFVRVINSHEPLVIALDKARRSLSSIIKYVELGQHDQVELILAHVTLFDMPKIDAALAKAAGDAS